MSESDLPPRLKARPMDALAIAILRQAIAELYHCADVGPTWFTEGRKGQMAHARAWRQRADKALAAIQSQENPGCKPCDDAGFCVQDGACLDAGAATIAEYDCADCGRHVIAWGYLPQITRCNSCQWIREHVPPADQPAAREQLGVPIQSQEMRGE
jgi:hypothetical protein